MQKTINYLSMSDEEFISIFNAFLDEAEMILDEAEQLLKIQGTLKDEEAEL